MLHRLSRRKQIFPNFNFLSNFERIRTNERLLRRRHLSWVSDRRGLFHRAVTGIPSWAASYRLLDSLRLILSLMRIRLSIGG
jgi:hypothetical protein